MVQALGSCGIDAGEDWEWVKAGLYKNERTGRCYFANCTIMSSCFVQFMKNVWRQMGFIDRKNSECYYKNMNRIQYPISDTKGGNEHENCNRL